ncbi:MmgE/PrpD family protein [Thalassospiraceae bacterium LMO-JJ14]|nr:MmgE/PrpD family protein [Thalassospiraceae bacterium LMO-JJ14]
MPDNGIIEDVTKSCHDDSNRLLASFVASGDFGALTEEGWISAARQIADTVAVGWAGSVEAGASQAAELALLESAAPAARLWGRAESVSVAQAVFVNAVSAAALDYDSVHQESLLHPAAITVPVALAIGEDIKASGEQIVAAHIAGCEVMCRISLATPRQSNWFPASVYGVFGATATASALLGLSTEQTLNAFGLALAQTSGTKQAIVERALAKRYQTAFAARAGVLSAALAKRGVTAAHRFLDGPAGLFSLYEEGQPEQVVAGLGQTYVFQNVTIKLFPTCLCTHVIIDAVLSLMAAHGFTKDDVSALKVCITPYMNRIIGGDYTPDANPQVAAQFSARYAAARALFSGGVKLADIEPAQALDPEVVRFARALDLTLFDDRDGHVAPCEVTVELKGGQTHTQHVRDVPNAAEGADAHAVLAEKAGDCLTRGASPMQPDAARRVYERLVGLRQAPSLDGLYDGA